MQIDRRTGLAPLGEVISLQHALHGDFGHEGEQIEKGKPAEPVAIVPHLRARDVDHLADLLQIIAGILFDLLRRQAGSRLVPTARVPDERSVVADDQDGLMPQFLK